MSLLKFIQKQAIRKTALIGGTKVSKSHLLRIESYGTVDELNAHIGLCKDPLKGGATVVPVLQDIQNKLLLLQHWLRILINRPN